MKLSQSELDLLHRTRVAMLALNATGAPSVSAGAYYHSGDSIWMTTSRYAHKVRLIRRNPRGSLLVSRDGRSLLVQGLMEVFDLRSVGGQLRAALNGPRFYMGLAGYTVKNLPFIGGYLLELDRVPGQWWPQNRLVLRLKMSRAQTFQSNLDGSADPASLPHVGRDPGRRLARTAEAHVCWKGRGGLLMEPCCWASHGQRLYVAFTEPPAGLQGEELAGAVVVEKHHPYRPTLMVGACYRGRLRPDPDAERLVAERYGLDLPQVVCGFRLEPFRINTWKGFDVESQAVA